MSVFFKMMSLKVVEYSDYINRISSENTDSISALTVFLVTISVIIFVAIIGIIVQKRFKKINMEISQKPTKHGKTGKEVAEEILSRNRITNVIVMIGNREGVDSYNPSTNQIVLSPSTYNSSSVSAAAIAAHECGHAIQWAKQEKGVRILSGLTKPVQIVTQFSNMLILVAFILILIAPFGAIWFSIAGIGLYGATLIFQTATLPVEFGASKKAINELSDMGYLSDEENLNDTKKVLRSAAMTYVIAALTSLLMLALIIFRMLARRN